MGRCCRPPSRCPTVLPGLGAPPAPGPGGAHRQRTLAVRYIIIEVGSMCLVVSLNISLPLGIVCVGFFKFRRGLWSSASAKLLQI